MQIDILVGRCRRRHAIDHQQPTIIYGLVKITIANETKGKVKSWRHDITSPLTEDVTDLRQESRQTHSVMVTIGDVHRAHHHEHSCHTLCRLVPSLVLKRRLGGNGNLHLCRRVNLRNNLYLVLAVGPIAQAECLSVARFGTNNESFRLSAVTHRYRSVRQKRYFLLERTLVLWQFLLFLALVVVAFLGVACRSFLRLSLLRSLVKPLVSLLEEWNLVVKTLHVERSVDVQVATVADCVAQRGAVIKVGTANPSVC